MIDMHVHILPGVDDGAKDTAQTSEMMQRAADAGIRMMIATPHVYQPEQQMKNCGALRPARGIARANGIALNMGCEFNYRAILKTGMENLDAYCLSGTKCILLELAFDRPVPGWEAMVSELADHGYLPIIAHPERYAYVQRDHGVAREMCALGCELQLDTGGLMAPLLSAERRTARKLLKAGMASYIASDAHSPADYDVFEKAYRMFRGEWPEENRLTARLRAQRKEKTDENQ